MTTTEQFTTACRIAIKAMGQLGNDLNWDPPMTIEYVEAMQVLKEAIGEVPTGWTGLLDMNPSRPPDSPTLHEPFTSTADPYNEA